MTPMQKTQKEFENGVKFDHFYVNTPICCPSRMQLLSGRYGHNIRDARLDPFPDGAATCGDEPVESPRVGSCGCMRMDCSRAFEEATYATALRRSGYATAYVGKYLNPPAMVRYCRNETLGPLDHGWPPGWDAFFGMCDQASTPQGAYYSVNWVDSAAGAVVFTGSEPADYTTSIVGNRSVAYLKLAPKDRPFFLAAAVRAPLPQLPPPGTPAFPTRCPRRRLQRDPDRQALLDVRNPPLSDEDAAEFDAVAGFVDLAPTFLAIAGAAAADGAMDGTSLLPLLEDDDDVEWREEMLVEYAPITNWLDGAHRRVDDAPDNNFRALRIVSERENALYAETTSLVDYDFEHSDEFFIEYYDLRHNYDPHQLHNLADKTSPGTRGPPEPPRGRRAGDVVGDVEDPRPNLAAARRPAGECQETQG
ncbi:sulfuric ester hydrolase [Aureococcus anophagefferens]|nr:sulfuric ester hydrolase [Aureococcus anophagefferens]